MNDFKPLDPPRFEYIDAVQKPEIDYKAAYELQRITIKRLCLLSTKLIAACEDLASDKQKKQLVSAQITLNKILLET